MRLVSRIALVSILIHLFFSSNRSEPGSGHLKLWYDHPADACAPDDPNGWNDDQHWLRALPLGNGSLGARVFGDVNRERIQLNEERHLFSDRGWTVLIEEGRLNLES